MISETLITADKARSRVKNYGGAKKALREANIAILTASADGETSKAMRGHPWDAPLSETLELCIERLRKAGYTVDTGQSGVTVISWNE